MFRATATFLVIFLVLHHDLRITTARSVENILSTKKLQKRQATETESNPKASSSELANTVHSRKKRANYAAGVRTTIAILAGASFGLSIGTTVYHAIRKCRDYRPDPCKNPTCTYYPQCPNICKNAETNRGYLVWEKSQILKRLDQMDRMQSHAFDLATNSTSAGLNNKLILAEIKEIYRKVDQILFDRVDMDLSIAAKFRNRSATLKSLIRNHRLTLDDIVGSPEMQGIFDKWTWEGTGMFVLSIALPLGLQLGKYLREKYLIHQIYKEMKLDFANRFQQQQTFRGDVKNRVLKNKFAYVQGYSTNKIDSQLKKSAKATYYGEKAGQKVTKTDKFLNNYLGPALNLLVTGLSIWTTYQAIDNCQRITNDMQDSAKDIANKRNDVEKLMVTKVEPLDNTVKQEVWDPVKNLLTNETTLGWLADIRNLTLGASVVNHTTAKTIMDFIDEINSSDVVQTIALQKRLIGALSSIEFQFSCYSDKQHAIAAVLRDCRSGRLPLPDLYKDAVVIHKLNRDACVNSKMVPYTTYNQFFTIVDAFAKHQGWYSNCILNNDDLLIRVCDTKLQGYTTSAQIVAQVNRTGLTEAMVDNFLTRCPPPKITPKKTNDTCKLYCLYETPKEIAKTVILLESQVIEIFKTCRVCSVRVDQKTTICTLHFCKGENASTIEPKVRLPLPTVQHVITSQCVQKCVLTDEQKKDICDKHKCKVFSAKKIAGLLAIPESTVNEVITNCNTILPSCGTVSKEDKDKVINLHCNLGASAQTIYMFKLVDLPLATIQSIIDNNPCP